MPYQSIKSDENIILSPQKKLDEKCFFIHGYNSSCVGSVQLIHFPFRNGRFEVGKVKSAYEPKWPIRPELIPVSVALSD